MNILGISGSPRVKHTATMLKIVLDATGAEYELVHLKDYTIRPCLNCKFCHKAFACAQKDDIHILHKKLVEADVIVFGSPTHFSNVSGIMKNFMDRCLPFYFSRQLEGKRVVILTVGGYGSMIERDENGQCVWCASDNPCARPVLRCLDAMRFFAGHLGMNVVGELYAIHGDPSAREKELIELGKSLSGEF